MSKDQTVRLHVELDIRHVDDDYDTGVTLERWNAMTPNERQSYRESAWQAATEGDSGGIWVKTEGATND